MQTVNPTPAAVEAFQSFYLAELDSRVQRSEVVGAITLKKGSAALFFEPAEGKFTLVEKMPVVEEANVFDCVPREQWGRMVMLFGHATNTGGYIASGHAILDSNSLKIKLASGHYYRMDVDATAAHLQPYVSTETQEAKEEREKERQSRIKRSPLRPSSNTNSTNSAKGGNNVRQFPKPPRELREHQQQVSSHFGENDECEDLTEEDLRRLRGEMPLSNKPKKKWKR